LVLDLLGRTVVAPLYGLENTTLFNDAQEAYGRAVPDPPLFTPAVEEWEDKQFGSKFGGLRQILPFYRK
jgi:hypothetical protein